MDDIGKPRAAVTVPRLAELNTYVPVRDLGGSPGQPITPNLVKGFQARMSLAVRQLGDNADLIIGGRTHERSTEQTSRNQ